MSEDFKNYWYIDYKVMKFKRFLLEFYWTTYNPKFLFDVSFRKSDEDHKGFSIEIGAFHRYLLFDFYDVRHKEYYD